jgi:DNA primase
VNKYIRERITKQEGRAADMPPPSSLNDQGHDVADNDILNLLQKDELHEKAIVRCLIEFGLKEWNETQRVADFIIDEFVEQHLIDDVSLMGIMALYTAWYKEGAEPTAKNFLYYEDQQMSASVVSLMDFPYELSPNWKDHFEGKILTREDLYKEEILSTVNYLKLRKIKKMIEENQKDFERMTSTKDQMMVIETHQHLKQMEMELLKNLGTVILK